jgi:FkbM family methyltransferase
MIIVKQLHKVKILRHVAKKVAKNIIIKQNFYQGIICMNAVEHAWAWTGKNSYDNFDAELQDVLYQASFMHNLLVDIGCNIGVMTIGTLLHNPTIKSIAIDPNILANKLLTKSLQLNKLESRCQILSAVVGKENGFINFDDTGSVTGHISSDGKKTRQIKLSDILNHNHQQKTLVKIDVEGYESLLVEGFKEIKNITGYTFFIEVHALGFNGTGDPEKVFSTLKEQNALITDLTGKHMTKISPDLITQIIVKFNAC